MYAFVSNECQTIVYTQRHLDLLIALFSYPKYKKIYTKDEAYRFFRECNRGFYGEFKKKQNKSSDASFISIEYFIDSNNIYVNADTKRFGFIKIDDLPQNVKQDATYDYIKLKICNVALDNNLISHHCAAISNILTIFDNYANLEIIVPDISVYLALTKYTGKNYIITSTQSTVRGRFGNVFYTLK